jgi:hypothetical protein
MATEYEYDTQTALLTTRFRGTVTDEDVIRMAETIAGDPRIAPGMRELMDLREVERAEVSRDMLQSIAALDRAHTAKFLGNRTAIVAIRDAHYGLARMYANMMEATSAPTTVRVFRDPDEARTWLQASDSRTDRPLPEPQAGA